MEIDGYSAFLRFYRLSEIFNYKKRYFFYHISVKEGYVHM